MYARLIIEKDAEINGRTDRFGTGGRRSPTVLVRAYSGDCPALRVAPTLRVPKRVAAAFGDKFRLG